MSRYENALIAMHKFLVALDCGWSEWIKDSLKEWREYGSSCHLKGAYGGMGSFNDVYFCETQNPITEQQGPWVNTFFDLLKSLLYELSYEHRIIAGGPVLLETNREEQLHIMLCEKCGFQEVRQDDIQRFVADVLLPGLINRYSQSLTLEKLVDEVLAVNISGASELTQNILTWAKANAVEVGNRSDYGTKCPSCRSKKTRYIGWLKKQDAPLSFEVCDYDKEHIFKLGMRKITKKKAGK